MIAESIYPRTSSDLKFIRPQRSDIRDFSFHESKINELLKRVKLLEDEANDSRANVTSVEEQIRAATRSSWFSDTIISIIEDMDGDLLPTHYHSVLVNPGTSTAAFSIDGDGGFVFLIAGLKLKVQLDSSGRSRTWYVWDSSTWQEVGDSLTF